MSSRAFPAGSKLKPHSVVVNEHRDRDFVACRASGLFAAILAVESLMGIITVALPISSSIPRSGKWNTSRKSAPAVPASNERPLLRLHNRQRVRINALLYKSETFQSVIICDISQGGAGLQNCPSLIENDIVTLKLMNGRSLKACVRWWLAGACGVRFTELLDDDDTLLNSLARVGSATAHLKMTATQQTEVNLLPQF